MKSNNNAEKVRELIRSQLESMKFKEVSPWTFEVLLGKDVIGRVGASKSKEIDGVFRIAPTASIRNWAFEQEARELIGRKTYDFGSCAVMSIGYLMPDRAFKEWYFNNQSFEAEAYDMTKSIQKYILPYLDRHRRKNVIFRAIDSSMDEYRDFIFPIALCHAGRVKEARKYVTEKLNDFKANRNPYFKTYSPFATAFLRRHSD